MENAIERCMILTDADTVDVSDFPMHIRSASDTMKINTSSPFFSDDVIIPLEKIKEEAIKHALRTTNGNILVAAKKLQLGRATIYRLMEKYKIDQREFETK